MKRRIFGIAAVALSALLLLYAAISYIIYDQLSSVTPGGGENAGNTPARFALTFKQWPGFDAAAYYMPQYQPVRFPSRQPGISLAGWYVAGDEGAPAVVLTHGLYACKCQPNILVAAGMLHRHGFHVLLYDLREHGGSDIEDGRAALGNEEFLDVLGAWDWLITSRDFSPERIGLYGQSLGAGATLIAFGEEPQAAAVFVDSPYADLHEIIKEELARNQMPLLFEPGAIGAAQIVAGDDLLAHSPQEAILRDAGRPIYLVHGTADQRIDPHHTQQLADLGQAHGADITIWLAQGADHVEAEFEYPAEYEQRLTDFFARALGG